MVPLRLGTDLPKAFGLSLNYSTKENTTTGEHVLHNTPFQEHQLMGFSNCVFSQKAQRRSELQG